MMLAKKIPFFFTLLPLCASISACQQVNAWERGNLAKPQMAIDFDTLNAALQAHTFSSKEAASGGEGVGGGGCGCN